MPGARASRPGLREAAYKPNAVPGRRALHGSEATPIRDLRDQFRSPALRAIGFKRSRMPGARASRPGLREAAYKPNAVLGRRALHGSEAPPIRDLHDQFRSPVLPTFRFTRSRMPGARASRPGLREAAYKPNAVLGRRALHGSEAPPIRDLHDQFRSPALCWKVQEIPDARGPRFAGRCKRSRMIGARASLEGARDPG
jgi:hypothetical protein